MKRDKTKTKSSKWHELQRARRLHDHMIEQLSWGNYEGDMDQAAKFIAEYKVKIVLLDRDVRLEEM